MSCNHLKISLQGLWGRQLQKAASLEELQRLNDQEKKTKKNGAVFKTGVIVFQVWYWNQTFYKKGVKMKNAIWNGIFCVYRRATSPEKRVEWRLRNATWNSAFRSAILGDAFRSATWNGGALGREIGQEGLSGATRRELTLEREIGQGGAFGCDCQNTARKCQEELLKAPLEMTLLKVPFQVALLKHHSILSLPVMWLYCEYKKHHFKWYFSL